MKQGKCERTVQLLCPTCAGSQFEYDDEDDTPTASVRCIGCGRETTKDKLVRENSENIQEHVKEVGGEVIRDVAKEMRNTLQKAFRGSKNIKFK